MVLRQSLRGIDIGEFEGLSTWIGLPNPVTLGYPCSQKGPMPSVRLRQVTSILSTISCHMLHRFFRPVRLSTCRLPIMPHRSFRLHRRPAPPCSMPARYLLHLFPHTSGNRAPQNFDFVESHPFQKMPPLSGCQALTARQNQVLQAGPSASLHYSQNRPDKTCQTTPPSSRGGLEIAG